MSKQLVIVESPAKSKTFKKYLDDGFVVKASVGHVRDLPRSDLGFDMNTFEAHYEPTERGRDVISSLRKEAKDAEQVWLATDDDREGEAIAWHLKEALGLKQYRRVTFNEITEKAIKAAFQKAHDIDMHKVNAQQGRRLLDRAIGYLVSPALSNAIGDKASAGRVQSPATRIIVELERRIRDFKKTAHFGVRVFFDDGNWYADLDTEPHVTKEFPYFTDRAAVERLLFIKNFTVLSCESCESKRNAPAPFTTSTMQQAASVALKFSPAETMKHAQSLFEAGYITYHRTDSTNLAEDALAAIRAYLQESGQAEHVSDAPNRWPLKDEAQAAHEAIRPSSISITDPEIDDAGAKALYTLIRNRVLACQMKPALYDNKVIRLKTTSGVDGFATTPEFVARTRFLNYKGWLSVSTESEVEDDDNNGDDQVTVLPTLAVGASIHSKKREIVEKETQPPKRLTEAGLVKALEREGIGRPSTYAAIIENIINRGYVEVKARKFHALPPGEKIVDSLVGRFTFIDLAYTRKMEEALDRVAQGGFRYQELVKHTVELVQREIEALSALAGAQFHCQECGNALRKLSGRNGSFWGCCGYESGSCKKTYPDDNGIPYFMPDNPEHFCPKCNCGLMRIQGKNGWFWRCSNSAVCSHSMDDKDGVPIERVVYPCPRCNADLLRRNGTNGVFWVCSKFNEGCKFTIDDYKGVPQATHACRSCADGYLRRFKDTREKGKFVWLCINYKAGCKVRLIDKKGSPVFA